MRQTVGVAQTILEYVGVPLFLLSQLTLHELRKADIALRDQVIGKEGVHRLTIGFI